MLLHYTSPKPRWLGFAIRALPQTPQSVLSSTLHHNSPPLRLVSVKLAFCFHDTREENGT
jgi:hypothetical protein